MSDLLKTQENARSLSKRMCAYVLLVPVIGVYVRSARFISKYRRGRGVFENFSDILSVEEVCEALRIGANQAYDLLSSGKLTGFKQGRVWKIPRQALIEYIVEKSKITI